MLDTNTGLRPSSIATSFRRNGSYSLRSRFLCASISGEEYTVQSASKGSLSTRSKKAEGEQKRRHFGERTGKSVAQSDSQTAETRGTCLSCCFTRPGIIVTSSVVNLREKTSTQV